MSMVQRFSRVGATAEGATLFATTMELVALTGGSFALGAFLGRNLTHGWALVFFVASFALLIGMRFTRSSSAASVTLLLGFGVVIGVATGPTVAYYTTTDPAAVWQAGGATALFMAALGTVGYTTRRDLSGLHRVALWGLFGLIIFGVVSIFLRIPVSSVGFSIIGLVVFAGLVLGDFQRLRRLGGVNSAPAMAASIFIDALNVFLFFLRIFGAQRN